MRARPWCPLTQITLHTDEDEAVGLTASIAVSVGANVYVFFAVKSIESFFVFSELSRIPITHRVDGTMT